VRPDDLDAIFDGALFGPPELEASSEEAARAPEGRTPVPVGAVDWYVERGAQATGPFRLERLRELWHQGELGPDTLFWCEAWPNWMPLSHVPELVAALTIAGLPTVGADASVTPAPSKKAGSGARKGLSALSSLVAEEEAWLRKMKEEREQAKEEERSALLDAPSAPLPAPAPVPVSPPVPLAAPVATAGLLAPVPAQAVPAGVPGSPYPYPPPGFGMPMAPPVAPAMMAAPVPVEAPAPSRRGLLRVAGVAFGSTAVGLIAGALFLMPRLQGAPAPAPEVSPRPVAAAPAPAPVAPAPVAPAPVVAAAPVVQQPAPVAQPVVPAPQPPPAAAPAPEKQEAKAVAAPAPSAPVAAPEKSKKVAAVRPEESAPAPQRRSQPAPVASVSPPANKALEEGKEADPTDIDESIDKDFERELGFAKDSPKQKPEDPRSKRTVYLPPEPGKALPESLSTSDIVQVVSANKDAILSCIEAHEPPRTSGSGKDRFVLRWSVQPGGTVSSVQMETDSLKGTPFARCMEGAVRSWKFPQHRVQSSEPIRFPFTY
jgi:hypothetical protein